jgi:hypothetical protein
MGAGGWNKGLKNVNGGGFSGHKHTEESIQKIKERPKESYKKPLAQEIQTNELCAYGCNQEAKYKFANNKLCCSEHHNSCPRKRRDFSDRTDHKDRAEKSLKTRIETGVTKSSRAKAINTMRENGFFDSLSEHMKNRWAENPWNPNSQCPLLPYKTTKLNYQGTYELKFLERLESMYGLDWIKEKVKRGPSIWYNDTTTSVKRLYISDFIIDYTIYEIKSSWTWNNHGKNLMLETKNKDKLNACLGLGYRIKLVLNGEEIDYVKS